MRRKNIIFIIIAAIFLLLAVYLVAEIVRVKPIQTINLPTKGGLDATASKSIQESKTDLLPEPTAKFIPEPLPEPNVKERDN